MYPIAIVQDRYNGTYSRGLWIAIAEADEHVDGDGPSRVRFVMNEGPGGCDIEAWEFWQAPPEWVAVGGTPNEALAALKAKSHA